MFDWVSHGLIKENKLILPYTKIDRERFVKGKRALEIIGCEHEVGIENVILNEKNSKALLFNLGLNFENFELKLDEVSLKLKEDLDVLSLINKLCRVKIKDFMAIKNATASVLEVGRPEN